MLFYLLCFLDICIRCAFLGKLALKKQEITFKNTLSSLNTIKMEAIERFHNSKNDCSIHIEMDIESTFFLWQKVKVRGFSLS